MDEPGTCFKGKTSAHCANLDNESATCMITRDMCWFFSSKYGGTPEPEACKKCKRDHCPLHCQHLQDYQRSKVK